MSDYGTNLRRLMARFDLKVGDVIERTGLDARTIKGVLNGCNQPQSHTLYRLATALNVSTDELFQEPSLLAHRAFDRETNPVVDEVIAARPELFEDWTEADYDELYSRFGTGGELTVEGTIQAAQQTNVRRTLYEKVAVVLETAEGDLLRDFVNLLYNRVVLTGNDISPE